ncbi:FAA hydrolase family protein [Ochrobactrum soli]|nr:FAA hydrolase family protein [[Ochrobactrum] soli]
MPKMTRVVNVSGRLKLKLADGIVDVEKASDGRFSSDPQRIYEHWDAFIDWASSQKRKADEPLPEATLIGTPVPTPRQIVAVGLNYHSHLQHSGLVAPEEPGVFAKFITSLSGPYSNIEVPSDVVFTEAELAIVLKREAYRVNESAALDYIAGVTVAQDLYDRNSVVKVAAADGSSAVVYINPSKSRVSFTPLGAEVVSLDEVDDMANLSIELDVNGVPIQRGHTSDLVFSVPALISRLSHKIRLLPGDVILTGSPARVEGTEAQNLRPGDVIRASIPGISEQRTVAVLPDFVQESLVA